jgi:hypothetical protein
MDMSPLKPVTSRNHNPDYHHYEDNPNKSFQVFHTSFLEFMITEYPIMRQGRQDMFGGPAIFKYSL